MDDKEDVMFRNVLSLCKSRRTWAVVSLALCCAGPVLAADKDKAGAHPGHGLVMCEGTYALCDAAPCTPIPEQGALPGSKPAAKPKHALCECVVETGKNLGPGPCANRQPITGSNGGEYILSTYSFALPDKYLECPAGGARTVCFGYPCLVDKADPKHAHCTCPIKYDSKAFWTQGGSCDKAACTNGLWQGGTPNDYALINKIFGDATHQPPPQMCGQASGK